VVAGTVAGVAAGGVSAVATTAVRSGDGVTGFSKSRKDSDPVAATVTPETLTRYSSGLKDEVSTGSDQVFLPPVPGWTWTIFAVPEKLPSEVFPVGENEEDVISTWRLSPAARFVVPERRISSPT
jgi:hypothetical protein